MYAAIVNISVTASDTTKVGSLYLDACPYSFGYFLSSLFKSVNYKHDTGFLMNVNCTENHK